MDLTSAQLRCLIVIRDLTKKQGCPPSLSEIAEQMWITPNAVRYHVRNLTEKGYLQPWSGTSRKTCLTDKAHDLFIAEIEKRKRK